MDSDSENDVSMSRTSTLLDDDTDVVGSVGGRSCVKGAARARVLQLESNSGWGGSADGEEEDRVNEIISLGGMMSAGNAERKKVQSMHAHTLSAPALSFPPPSAINATAASSTLDTANIVPPPDKSGWSDERRSHMSNMQI
jgi:hypothetical protein